MSRFARPGGIVKLVFASGQTSNTFLVRIIDDSLVERKETVLLVLTNAAGGATFPMGPLARVRP